MMAQTEDLRAAVINLVKNEMFARDNFFASDHRTDEELADAIIRLCEAAALAALPKQWKLNTKAGESHSIEYWSGHNDAIATAQANIHSVFGGTSNE